MATEASRVLADSDPEYLVALAAAVLGGGAFIVAILQALLQYLNSNNSRWKCTKSAIGYANKHVKTRWSIIMEDQGLLPAPGFQCGLRCRPDDEASIKAD